MFTIGDIRNIAVQIEKNGEETYRTAGEAAQDPKIKELLLWMADEEKRHRKWFSSLTSDKPLTAEQQKLEAVGKTLLQDMVKGNTFLLDPKELANSSTIQEILTRSQQFEQDTILFYEFLQGFLDDEDAIAQLGEIIEEERTHMEKIEQLVEPLAC